MHTVALVVFDRISPFEMAVPCEVFGADRSDMGLPNYRFLVCAAEEGLLRTDAGFGIVAPHGLEGLREAQTVVVPAWRDVEEAPPAELIEALRQSYGCGARIVSLCSGAFVLAAAGLLDGRRATTHWMYAERLAKRFPAVEVDPNVLYIDQGQIFTSAGTAAGIDLCLHLVRLDHGAEVANAFARRMVVPPHRDGGQAQYVEAPMPPPPDEDLFTATLAWMHDHLDEDLTIADLADRAATSERHFARRFAAATGTTPHRWLVVQRVGRAQQLLETTDLPVQAVAERSGLGTPANLRKQFRRHLRTAPSAYRATFTTDR